VDARPGSSTHTLRHLSHPQSLAFVPLPVATEGAGGNGLIRSYDLTTKPPVLFPVTPHTVHI
jgi:hypothetical protein